MATRTKTYQECDRAGCRNRTGVKDVGLTLEDFTNRDGDGDPTILESLCGELCPAHIEMVKRFMANLFKNTKQYDEPEVTKLVGE